MRTVFFFIFALNLVGCGTYTSVTQTEEETFLQLIGDTASITLELDNKSKINLQNDTQSFDLNGREATKIRVNPGQHHVILSKNGSVIVNRTIFVSEGNTFEVVIP